jgi:hypothetical protein
MRLIEIFYLIIIYILDFYTLTQLLLLLLIFILIAIN